MAERSPGRGRAAREPTRDGSSSRTAITLTGAGVIAGLLLVVTEFSVIASVDVASGSCEVINDADPELADRCELSGFERHGGAFLLLGLLAGAMAWGAGLGGSRPAAVALAGVGGIVLLIALLNDLPEAGETGAIGANFEGATASAGTGLYLELIGGALALLTGLLRLAGPRDRA